MAAPKNRPSKKPKKRSQATAKIHGLCFTYGICRVIKVVVANMTVATENLIRVQEGLEGIKVYGPICVAQTNEVRKYEQKSNRSNADCGYLLGRPWTQRQDKYSRAQLAVGM